MHREGRPVRKTVPVNLIVDGRTALVVGGGRVGLRKVRGLLDAGAPVRLVCPDAVPELVALAAEGRISWDRREWRPGDSGGALLAYACTDSKHVNREILEDSRAVHTPCACADLNWPDGDFTTPAVARCGDLTIAVSTSGQSCAAARDAKDEMAAHFAAGHVKELLVVGTSDALLSARRRASYHLPAEARVRIGVLLRRVRGLREFFILNTCNRIELAAVVSGNADEIADVVERLLRLDDLSASERFRFRGADAFRHLVRVTAGLESSLLGEYHIVAQMKAAMAEAESNGWAGPSMRSAGHEVLRVSKDVRHATEGLLRVVEIDQVAVRYLTVHGGLDESTRVLVIGSGMVGSGAVAALLRCGAQVTWAYHRHRPENVPAAEGRATLEIVPWDAIPSALGKTDIVLSAVDAAQPVVTAGLADAVRDRNVLMVDLGVPRNIDPFFDDWGHGVTVADLDDLKLWHRVKTGTLNEVIARADAIANAGYAPLA